MTIEVIITSCVAFVVTAFAIWSIVKSFKAADKINNRLAKADDALAKSQAELEDKERKIDELNEHINVLRSHNRQLEDIIKGLEDTVTKEQARCVELEQDQQRTPMYYIQLKWSTPDDPGWEHLTKDLFYTRRVFRSLREAAKEAKKQVKNPFISSVRILKTKERVLGKKEWRDLV